MTLLSNSDAKLVISTAAFTGTLDRARAQVPGVRADRWVLIEDIGSFQFEGIKVFAAPDFGYWNAADRLLVEESTTTR